jgi:hypothetical protein
MRKMSAYLFAVAVIGMVAVGCTATTTQKGAAIGAAGGAVLGQAIGRDTKSTLLGAAAGGLAGALAGEQVGKQQEALRSAQNEAAETRRELEQLKSGQGQPARAAATYNQGQYRADPTVGEFSNNTRWVVKVYVDAPTNDLKRVPQLSLEPYETVPANLDVGEHRVSAVASVKTQFGERTVGRYDKVIQVDPRGDGWRVSFDETSFN